MEKIYTNNAPEAIGPYSQAIKVGNLPQTKLMGRLKDKKGKVICIHNKQLKDTQNN